MNVIRASRRYWEIDALRGLMLVLMTSPTCRPG